MNPAISRLLYKMRDLFPGYYKPSVDQYRKLWRECDFAFDANVLLDLYRSTPETQESFLDVLVRIRSRVWLPHQAAYEFLENRLETIATVRNAYRKVEEILEDAVRRIDGGLGTYRKHPVIDVEEIVRLFRDAGEDARRILKERETYHPNYRNHDPILEKLTLLFAGRVGPAFNADQVGKISKEAEERFRKKIPPGYKDRAKPETKKYGDVFVWYQLLEHAAEAKRGIIFVTGDLKEDWWLEHDGETISPRPDLAQEMLSKANVPFLMYTPPRFILHAQEHVYLKDHEHALTKAAKELKALAQHKEIVDDSTEAERTQSEAHRSAAEESLVSERFGRIESSSTPAADTSQDDSSRRNDFEVTQKFASSDLPKGNDGNPNGD